MVITFYTSFLYLIHGMIDGVDCVCCTLTFHVVVDSTSGQHFDILEYIPRTKLTQK